MATVWNRERRSQRRARSASAHERGGESADLGVRTSGRGPRSADLGARSAKRSLARRRCAISPPLTGERGGTTRARSASVHWRGGSRARSAIAHEREARSSRREREARAHTGTEVEALCSRARSNCGCITRSQRARREHTESTPSSGSAHWRARSGPTQSLTVPHSPTLSHLSHTAAPCVAGPTRGLLGAY